LSQPQTPGLSDGAGEIYEYYDHYISDEIFPVYLDIELREYSDLSKLNKEVSE